MSDGRRGTGRTTRQMLAAPQGALYVTYGNVSYYRELARKHGREDLRLVECSQFTTRDGHRYWGRTFSGIVLDHAIVECASPRVRGECASLLMRLQPYIRTVAPSSEPA